MSEDQLLEIGLSILQSDNAPSKDYKPFIDELNKRIEEMENQIEIEINEDSIATKLDLEQLKGMRNRLKGDLRSELQKLNLNAEKIRKNISNRIKLAQQEISEHNINLASFLQKNIDTGYKLIYAPLVSIDWKL